MQAAAGVDADASFAVELGHIAVEDALGIAVEVFAHKRPRAVEIESQLRAAAEGEVFAEAGRDFNHHARAAVGEHGVDVVAGGETGALAEVGRTVEFLRQLAAVMALVLVEHGEVHFVYVERHAEAT